MSTSNPTSYEAIHYVIFFVLHTIENRMKSVYHLNGRQNCPEFGTGGCSVEEFNSAWRDVRGHDESCKTSNSSRSLEEKCSMNTKIVSPWTLLFRSFLNKSSLAIHMKQLGSNWTSFHKISHWWSILKLLFGRSHQYCQHIDIKLLHLTELFCVKILCCLINLRSEAKH